MNSVIILNSDKYLLIDTEELERTNKYFVVPYLHPGRLCSRNYIIVKNK